MSAEEIDRVLAAAEQPRWARYATLGVERSAAADEIRKRYRKLALKFHPDKNSDPRAASAFIAVGAAFECLSDAAARADYDNKQRGSSTRRTFSGRSTGGAATRSAGTRRTTSWSAGFRSKYPNSRPAATPGTGPFNSQRGAHARAPPSQRGGRGMRGSAKRAPRAARAPAPARHAPRPARRPTPTRASSKPSPARSSPRSSWSAEAPDIGDVLGRLKRLFTKEMEASRARDESERKGQWLDKEAEAVARVLEQQVANRMTTRKPAPLRWNASGRLGSRAAGVGEASLRLRGQPPSSLMDEGIGLGKAEPAVTRQAPSADAGQLRELKRGNRFNVRSRAGGAKPQPHFVWLSSDTLRLQWRISRPGATGEPDGAVLVESVTSVKPVNSKKGVAKLVITTPTRSLKLEAMDADIRDEWLVALKALSGLA